MASVEWIIKYSTYPLVNFSSIYNQMGTKLLENQCYYLYWFIPAAFRGNSCWETLDFYIPELTSPSSLLSPLYTSWGIAGMIGFCFIIGVFIRVIFLKTSSSYWARFAYALCAWSLISVGSYNHFLNPYILYYPMFIYFICSRYYIKRTTSPVQ